MLMNWFPGQPSELPPGRLDGTGRTLALRGPPRIPSNAKQECAVWHQKNSNRSAGGSQMLRSLGKLARVAALLAVVVVFMAPSAMAGSSADEIKNCPAQNWCSYHRTVDTGWRYSSLDQINTRNVKQFSPVWNFQPGEPRMGLQRTPIV